MSKKNKISLHPLTVLFIIVILVSLLTTIVPKGHYKYREKINNIPTGLILEGSDIANYSGEGDLEPIAGTYESTTSDLNLFTEIVTAPVKGMMNAMDIILFLFSIGAFIAVTNRSGIFDRGLFSILRNLEGREYRIIPFVVFLGSLGGSIFGMEEETLAFYPLLLNIVARLGFDLAIVPMMVIGGTMLVGIWNSTINPFAIGIAAQIADTSLFEGIWYRIIMLILFNIGVSWYIIQYARRVKINPTLSILRGKEDLLHQFYAESSQQQRKRVFLTGRDRWTLFVYISTFVILIYSVLPLENTFLADYYLGWWLEELSTLFIVSAILIGFINRLKNRELLNTMIQGAQQFVMVAFIVGVSRSVSLILENSMVQDTILHSIELFLKDLSPTQFLLSSYFFLLPFVFLIPSTSTLAKFSIPIIASLASMTGTNMGMLMTIFLAAIGTVNPINPTNGVVVGGISLIHIDISAWFRLMLPLILFLAVISLVIALAYNTLVLTN